MSQPVSRWQCTASDSKYSTCTSELAAQNDHRHQTCPHSTQPTHCTTDSLAQLHTTIIPDNVELCNTDSIHKADTARPTALARRSRPRSGSDSSRVSERPRTTVSALEHCIPVSSADMRRHLRSAIRHLQYSPYRVSGSALMAVGRSQLLARWPGTLFLILSGIPRAAQTVLGVYLNVLVQALLVHPAH